MQTKYMDNIFLIKSIKNDSPEPWGTFFQDHAAPQMEGLEELHNNIMFYLAIILFALNWIMVSIVINLKKKNIYNEHNRLVELIWTISPVLILILIAFSSFKLFYLMDEVIDPVLEIYNGDYEWYWSYPYPYFYDTLDYAGYDVEVQTYKEYPDLYHTFMDKAKDNGEASGLWSKEVVKSSNKPKDNGEASGLWSKEVMESSNKPKDNGEASGLRSNEVAESLNKPKDNGEASGLWSNEVMELSDKAKGKRKASEFLSDEVLERANKRVRFKSPDLLNKEVVELSDKAKGKRKASEFLSDQVVELSDKAKGKRKASEFLSDQVVESSDKAKVNEFYLDGELVERPNKRVRYLDIFTDEVPKYKPFQPTPEELTKQREFMKKFPRKKELDLKPPGWEQDWLKKIYKKSFNTSSNKKVELPIDEITGFPKQWGIGNSTQGHLVDGHVTELSEYVAALDPYQGKTLKELNITLNKSAWPSTLNQITWRIHECDPSGFLYYDPDSTIISPQFLHKALNAEITYSNKNHFLKEKESIRQERLKMKHYDNMLKSADLDQLEDIKTTDPFAKRRFWDAFPPYLTSDVETVPDAPYNVPNKVKATLPPHPKPSRWFPLFEQEKK